MRSSAEGKIAFEHEDPMLFLVFDYLRAGKEKDFASSAKLWGELLAKYPQFIDGLHETIVTYKN